MQTCAAVFLWLQLKNLFCLLHNKQTKLKTHSHFLSPRFSLCTPTWSSLEEETKSESASYNVTHFHKTRKHNPSSLFSLSKSCYWPSICLWLIVSRLLTIHTWQCPVSNVDSAVQQTAASLLNLLDGCSSGQALSNVRGWNSELRPERHSLPLWPDNLTD